MADEVVSQGGGAGAADAGGSGGASVGGAGGGSGAAGTSGLSDAEFLATQAPAEAGSETTAIVPTKEAPAAKEAATQELLKPGALEIEEGEPEWFASVKDAKAAAASRELWKANQEYAKHFKTPGELTDFFKDLPGGRDQIAAMQTLTKEVGELDSAIEGTDFAGHLSVAERVLGQAPANALSITRAWAQTVAKSQPEAWNQISTELVNSTLKAAGVGVDLSTLLGGLREMRDAITAQDAEAFGRAASKLVATPEAPKSEDPNLVKLRTDAQTAQQERDRVLTESWERNVGENVSAVEQSLRQDIGTKLSTVLMDSTKDSTRKELTDKIIAEVDMQIDQNSWLRNQISSLVGSRANNARNLQASKDDWAKALNLSKDACKPLISAAMRKVVSAWAKEMADTNQAARNKAKGGAARVDVGASSQPKNNGKGQVTLDMVQDRNVSDEDLLKAFSTK
jgi:hypothetical protein